MVETARLESVFALTGNVGSNPTLSAISAAGGRAVSNIKITKKFFTLGWEEKRRSERVPTSVGSE